MGPYLLALVSACIGFVGVVAGVIATGRREEKRWFREQKLNGLNDFITSTIEVFDHNIGATVREKADVDRLIEKMSSGRTTVNLLCEVEVVDNADRLARLALQATSANNDAGSDERFYSIVRSLTLHARAELSQKAPRGLQPATPRSDLGSQAWTNPETAASARVDG